MPRVVFYTQPGSSACVAANEFLFSRGVSFEEKDTCSEPVVIGFDLQNYEAALGAVGP